MKKNKPAAAPKRTKVETVLTAKAPSRSSVFLSEIWIYFPALVYCIVVAKFASNIPFWDDYDAILEYVIKFKHASFGGKLQSLLQQHGEHRIFHSRVIYALYYSLFGSINFKVIIALANLQLLVVFYIISRFIKRFIPSNWMVYAFLTGLFLFDINNYENADWAMAGLQNYGIVMWLLLSLYAYSKGDDTKHLALGGLFQAIMILSSGNGLLGAICLCFFAITQKKLKTIIVTAAVSVVFIGLYFFGYAATSAQKAPLAISKIIPFFLHLAGAHFSYDYGMAAGVAVLLALLAVVASFWLKRKIFAGDSSLFIFLTLLIFVLGSMASIAVFRSGKEGLLASYSSRYFIYTHLLAGFAVLGIGRLINGKKFVTSTFIAVMMLVSLVTYRLNYEYGIGNFRLRLSYRENPADFHFPDKAYARKITEEACKEGIYCIDDYR